MHNAVRKLDRLQGCHVLRLSRIYRTAPIGPKQPRFYNAAARVETSRTAHDLLEQLWTIEQELGRKRTLKWGPRRIDLDILWSDNVQVQTPALSIPHPELLNRAFALVPLLEVAPELPAIYLSHLEVLQEQRKTMTVVSPAEIRAAMSLLNPDAHVDRTNAEHTQPAPLTAPLEVSASLRQR